MTLSGAMENFLATVRIARSEHTYNNYAQWMRHLLRWAGDVDIADVTPDLLIAFIRATQTDGDYRASTVYVMLAAVSQLFNFLCEEGILDLSMGDYLMFGKRLSRLRPPLPKQVPKVPDEDSVQKVLWMAEAMSNIWDHSDRRVLYAKRNHALIHALRSTGARVSEIAALRVKDLRPRSHTAKCMGKGKKERLLRFDDKAWAVLQEYLTIRAVYSDKEPLFPSHAKNIKEMRPMSTESIRLVLKRFCQYAEVEPITPHQFRHRFATGILAATHDLAATQDLMGHANPEVTRRYAVLSDEQLSEAHKAAFERGTI